ncbi:MAG: hypothetical protein HQL51_10955 [Magnetococcales bacterium]|nr:hypothetical protein [Magnetococcales bacterium]
MTIATPRRLTAPLLAAACLLLAGCSTNFKMPWEENRLDPSRVHTYEPLEVPPDLEVLPDPANPADQSQTYRGGTPGGTASSILFNTPAPQPTAPLTRNQKEKLPEWMGSSGQPPGAAGGAKEGSGEPKKGRK